MKLSNVVERTIDVVCLIASFAILYLLPDRINALFYLLFAVSAFLFCIGFFRLIATFDEPDSPEEAWLAGLVFVAGGAAVNACGIYGVYAGKGTGRSIMIATVTLIEAMVLYAMAGGLARDSKVKKTVSVLYKTAAVLLAAGGVFFAVREHFSERSVILGTMLLIEAVCLWTIRFESAKFKK